MDVKEYKSSTYYREIPIANGYISTTKIYCELEEIYLVVEAKGHIDFLDKNEQLITSFEVEKPDNGKGVYTEIHCKVEDGTLYTRFPIYSWYDNYPNCDGEYDRWDSITIGYYRVGYNLETKEVSMIEEKGR